MAQELGTPVPEGLDDAAVLRSREQGGENRLPPIQERSVWSMFVGALRDRTLLILVGAAFLSIIVDVLKSHLSSGSLAGGIDGAAILVAVLVAALVTTFNEARAAKQFRLLSKMRDDVVAKVERSGHVRQVSVFEVVMGDVVHFELGDRLCADGLLLEGVDVALDESMLTGESVPKQKSEEDLQLFGGTTVVEGAGRLLVTKVGALTEMGKLQLSLTEPRETPTPLQERLSKLADRIGVLGLSAAVFTFLGLFLSGFSRGTLPQTLDIDFVSQVLEYAVVAVTIVVVAVPEGLPLAVTISLAYSVRKMALDQNLVRTLASCETMGSATVVCSDKTGTLTKNRMSVVAGWFDGAIHDRIAVRGQVPEALIERIAEGASVNSTAFVEKDEGGDQYLGNPTECALLVLVRDWGEDWKARRQAATVLHRFAFNSDRKRMSSLMGVGPGVHRLLVKGAPEVLLERSVSVEGNQGPIPFDASLRRSAQEAERVFSSRGYRTLALAYREFVGEEAPNDVELAESSLTLVCLLAISDPLRSDAKEAVNACRKAGLDVKIVTGDHALTAQTIAKELGVLGDGDLILDGARFRQMSDEEVRIALKPLRILARSVPSDKLRLVQMLQGEGEVVAVTGDGTNDGPALASADVGFSMGLSGTEVAKEASDIVILDDNFRSIVAAVRWGRSIFENIRKFLQFQLTVNLVALSTAFLAAVFGYGIPLNTVQLLWVNLLMDTLAALALATEPPDPKLLDEPPYGRHAPLVTGSMGAHILVMGALMLVVLFMALMTDWFVPSHASEGVRRTFVFNCFVFLQLFNEINARATRFGQSVWRRILKSHLFLFVLVSTAFLQVLIVEFGGAFFRTEALTMELWVKSVLLGSLSLIFGAVLRFFGRLFFLRETRLQTHPC